MTVVSALRTGRSYTPRTYAQDEAVYATWGRRAGLGLIGLGLVAFPAVASGFSVNVANLIGLAVVGSLALNLLTGVAGQISLGNAAFLAAGGFAAGVLSQEAETPFLVALAGGAAVSAVLGLVVGLPALRLRGLYLVIATLALHFVTIYALRRYQTEVVGAVGFRPSDPAVGGWTLDTVREWYYVIVVTAVLAAVVVFNLLRSRFGRAWSSIRDADIAAEILGVDVARYKLFAFVASSALIGIQGVLTAYFTGVVEIDTFTLDLSIRYIAMILIGGMGSVLGSILGAAFVVGLPFVVREVVDGIPAWFPASSVLHENVFQVEVALYGLSVVLFVLFEPQGLAHVWRRVQRWFRLWPFTTERAVGG